MRNIVIVGIDTLLGSYFAARCLQERDDRVFYCPWTADALSGEEISELVSHAARQIAGSKATVRDRKGIEDRMQRAGSDLNVYTTGRTAAIGFDEVWYFADSKVGANQAETLEEIMEACVRTNAKEFNYVGFDNIGCHSESDTRKLVHSGVKTVGFSDEQISLYCKEQGVEYRMFSTSLIVGSGHPSVEHSTGLSQFLAALHSFKTEIEERSPQYFDFHALRCFASRGTALNLVTADLSSDLLLRIARTEGTAGSSFPIVSPHNTPLSALCERIGVAYGLGLLVVEDFGVLNAVDRAFHERTGGVLGHLSGRPPELPCTQAFVTANLPLDSAVFDEEAQIALFELVRRNQDDAWTERRRQIADLPSRLLTRTIARSGSDLNYCIAGSTGTAVVVLNALGQGLECWYRLIENLMESYRVIIWEPRGMVAPPPPFGMKDQVDDLDAILRHENIESCHLVGWCTGTKVAIDFHLRRPSAVRSMAFLNGTFKCDGSPEELSSPYEQYLESLCRMLVRKPAMAASVMKNLQFRTEKGETEILRDVDKEQMSVSVLSLMNVDLRNHVLAPFRSEETTLNYARQLVDFWSHDSRPRASEVQVPVLLMGAEYDQVAAPAASQMAAGLFPNARHVHVGGATHYCIYDRADFVGGLLKTFFENPDELPVAQGVQDTVAQAQ